MIGQNIRTMIHLSTGEAGWCSVVFRYDERDPLAVTLLFPRYTGGAEWRVDREMVTDTLEGAPISGAGDVVTALEGDWLRIWLTNGVTARVDVPVNKIAEFLGRTYLSVPPGGEEVDVDELIRRIFEEV